MNDTAGVKDGLPQARAPCRCTLIEAVPAVLWQQARHRCDLALAQGSTFVAILRAAQAFAEEGVLADADRQRAARFRQAADRHNFVLGRTLVHHLVRPAGAPLPYVVSLGLHGKPFLPHAPAYSIAHSGPWIACAISRGEPIGIDVETFARLGDYRELLPAVAHPAERRLIEQAPASDRQALFKRCWTRKEAVLKAIGTGLSDKLQDIDVCLDQEEPLLSRPAALRVVDLPLAAEAVTVSLAQAPSAPGIVAMVVLADGSAAGRDRL